jgi:ABC-2 type transport system permease protein
MKNLSAAFITECMKLRRSKIFWITIVFFIFVPLMMGLLMLVAQNPEIGEKLGIVGTKAKLFGENNWEGYLLMLNQIVASVGLIGFGFVTSWVFGREYIDRTITNIMALPVSRSAIVTAKFGVVVLWCFLLVLIILVAGISIGHLIGISGWSDQVFNQFINKFILISGLTILLSSPVGFIASYGKGIIAPIAFVIVMLIMSQFVALVGLGPYFPWAVPGVLSVPEGTEGMEIVSGSYIIVLIASLVGFFGTIAWWKDADQK